MQLVLHARNFDRCIRCRLPWPQIHHDFRSTCSGCNWLHHERSLHPVRAYARFFLALVAHDLCPFSLKNHIAAFAVVYGIFLSFGELGPGNCLGMLAAKSGPTAVRGQFYGAAAAIGKVGAFVGTWAFPPIIEGTLLVSRICIDCRKLNDWA